MGNTVNPPPFPPIPKQFSQDLRMLGYFQHIQKILLQLQIITGGGTDGLSVLQDQIDSNDVDIAALQAADAVHDAQFAAIPAEVGARVASRI